jgi:hypothetical protein
MKMMEREVLAAENSVVGRRDIFKEKLSTNNEVPRGYGKASRRS